jgi:hypothetical protein
VALVSGAASRCGVAPPRRGAYLVSDLPADRLCRIACRKCDRRGSYRRDTLAARYGGGAALDDVIGRLAACPYRGDLANPCGVVYLEPLGMTAAEHATLQVEVEAARLARHRPER